MNELLNELYCVGQLRFIFGSGWNAGVTLSMFQCFTSVETVSLTPVVRSAGSSGPAGSPQPPAPSVNHAAGSSRTRQRGVRG